MIMAAPMSVFLCTGMDADRMVAEIERILCVKLLRVDDGDRTWWEHHGVGYRMSVVKDHGLVDDLGIPFSRYDDQIDFVVVMNGARPEDAQNLKHWLATYAFGKLTAALGCKAMLVYDLQEIIEQTG